MKWNIEWVDLQNIERMTSECWRLSEKQLQQYCERLSQQKELLFAGEMGLAFLEIMEGLSKKQVGSIWSDVQKDVHMIQKMIQQGIEQDKHYWIRLYHDLSDQPEFYFYTRLGDAFIHLISEKLELSLPEEQKFLRHDIRKIQEICDTCDFQDEIIAKETIASLKEQENMLFLSWLGVDFLHIIDNRFGEKQEPMPEPETEPKKARQSRFRKKKRESVPKNFHTENFHTENFNTEDFGNLDAAKDGLEKDDPVKDDPVKDDPDQNLLREQNLDFLEDLEALSDFDAISEQEIFSEQEAILNEELPAMRTEQKKPDKVKEKKSVKAAKIIWTVVICVIMCALGVYLLIQINKREIAKKAVESLKNNKTGQIEQTEQIEQIEQTNPDTGGIQARSEDVQVAAQTEKFRAKGGNAQQKTEKKASGKNPMPDVLPQYQSFHSQYPDLFGWLKIPDTEIDHPIMQSKEDTGGELYFYLHRDYQGNATEEGSLFVDSKSSCYPQDGNTVIYGHNMKNGRNFGMLERYEERAFCESHRTIYYDTIYEKGKYQVVAVLKSRVLYQEEPGFRYYRLFNYKSKEEFQECVDFIKQSQIYDLGARLSYGDKLLMLSTCDYSRENGRLVVVAVKV